VLGDPRWSLPVKEAAACSNHGGIHGDLGGCNGPSVASLPSRRPPAERDAGGGAWRPQCPLTGMKADERGGGRGVHRRIHLRGRGQGVHRREVQGTRCRLASAREIQPWRMTGLGAVDSLHGPPAVDSGINSSNTTMRPLLPLS
jgi:hypothetical protein